MHLRRNVPFSETFPALAPLQHESIDSVRIRWHHDVKRFTGGFTGWQDDVHCCSIVDALSTFDFGGGQMVRSRMGSQLYGTAVAGSGPRLLRHGKAAWRGGRGAF